jgi:hypothetical protein
MTDENAALDVPMVAPGAVTTAGVGAQEPTDQVLRHRTRRAVRADIEVRVFLDRAATA